jgi:RND family efflux transporter MFP subunit
MKTLLNRILLLGYLAAMTACGGHKDAGQEDGVVTTTLDEQNKVTVQTLKRQAFEHELVSNGKIVAGMQADLHFESVEVVAQIFVKNGDHVSKGQKIAELDKFRLNQKTVQAKDALDKAKLELQDVLIGQGYSTDKQSDVPENIMKLARVKSGYDNSLSQYELAVYEEKHATLTAPFDGTIANLFSKPYNVSSTSEAFCTVVGSQRMDVDFSVLESELQIIRKGDKIVVTPYSDTDVNYEGRITEINPIVDDNGLVKVRAAVAGNSKLFSGMNVRVSVRRLLDGQLVIPKSAVVMRSGKQVVFTLKGNKAQWNYVHTGLENADSYSVTDGLKEGDVVITTGNINLAHDAEVITM